MTKELTINILVSRWCDAFASFKLTLADPCPGLSSALTRPQKLCLQKQSPICPKAGYGMRRMQ